MRRLTPGTVFAQDFEIVRPLAEGGMGCVYVARQRSTGKERALKIMLPQFALDVRTRERFTREARAASQVDSEHVVETVGAGVDAESGVPWLAMELLRGEDLGSYASRVGVLGSAQVADIFRQLCHGLGSAHAAGLVHRDLKPENVFLSNSRHSGVPYTVKLLDFGIAKVVQETQRIVTEAVGTPMWMAPEQTEPGHAITPAADVWALGLMAFQLLTGVSYWRAANAENSHAIAVLREVVYDPLVPASERARELGARVSLGTEFDVWFSRCVDRNVARRFPNATAAFAALSPVLERTTIAHPDPVAGWHRVEPVPETRPGTPPAFTDGDLPPATVPENTVGSAIPGVFSPASGAPPSIAGEDVDTYERRLSQGRAWIWVAATLVVLGLGVGALQYRARLQSPPVFEGREMEPNDRAPRATPVPFGTKVIGQLGRRIDEAQSDIDFYRVDVPADAGILRFDYRALPNIAPCLLWFRPDKTEPFARYCPGEPARDLSVPAMRLSPGAYFIGVTQDRDPYANEPATPVLENISDFYEIELASSAAAQDIEIEPNDSPKAPNPIQVGMSIRGRLEWMRDVDAYCVEPGNGKVQFVVEESDVPRPRGAVLEATTFVATPEAMDTGKDAVVVRVHADGSRGRPTAADVLTPFRGPELEAAEDPVCLTLRLVHDPWAEAPLQRVSAGKQEYTVRLEAPVEAVNRGTASGRAN